METADLAHLLVSGLAHCLLLAKRPGPDPIAYRGPEPSEEHLPPLVELGPNCLLRPLAAHERWHTRWSDAKNRPFFLGLYLASSSRELRGSGRSKSPHLA